MGSFMHSSLKILPEHCNAVEGLVLQIFQPFGCRGTAMLEIIVLFHDPVSPKPQLSDRQPHILLQNTSVYEFMVDSVAVRSLGHVVLSVQLSLF